MKVSGLDVHKDTIFCAVYDGKKYGEVREYLTFTEPIQTMGNYLHSEGVKRIAIESTGIYWIPVWNILEKMGFELMLVNPYLIKQMPGRKSDIKDAQWIAKLLHKGLLRGSLVPDKTIRQLRTYSRQFVKTRALIVRSTQEMERAMELSNIRITSLVSQNSGLSVLKVVEKTIAGEDTVEELACCIHSRTVNAKGDLVRLSLDGHIEEHHRFTLALAYEQFKLYTEQSKALEGKMEEICELHFSHQMELLQSIPGVGKQAAMQIISETGGNMEAFENSGKLTGWTGLRPRNDESAGKYKSTATTHGNKYLRRIIVQCAWAASRTKGSFYKTKFEQLCIRKSRKKALIAIARKLLTVVWHVLSEDEPFNPKFLPVYDPKRLQMKVNYHRKEIEKLEQLGYTVT
ncbi:MAG: IS110 family transposase [Bacteroidales bacterium]|nr:IS110 family transposase [Bacteroidales bacterium]